MPPVFTAGDIDSFYEADGFAGDITYTPKGGAPSTVRAIGLDEQSVTVTDEVLAEQVVMTIRASDVVLPGPGDTAVIEGRNAVVRAAKPVTSGLEHEVLFDLGGEAA